METRAVGIVAGLRGVGAGSEEFVELVAGIVEFAFVVELVRLVVVFVFVLPGRVGRVLFVGGSCAKATGSNFGCGDRLVGYEVGGGRIAYDE